jgi:hypothetical protein
MIHTKQIADDHLVSLPTLRSPGHARSISFGEPNKEFLQMRCPLTAGLLQTGTYCWEWLTAIEKKHSVPNNA